MNLSDNVTQIILAVVAALVGAGLIFRIVIRTNKRNGGVDVRNSSVTGDIAGGNINKAGRDIKK